MRNDNSLVFTVQVDPSITKTAYSYAVAGFSIGLAIGSPIFGFWINRVRSGNIVNKHIDSDFIFSDFTICKGV